jgi:NTE family protein
MTAPAAVCLLESGHKDTKRTLKHQKWLVMPPPGSGILVHDVHRETD